MRGKVENHPSSTAAHAALGVLCALLAVAPLTGCGGGDGASGSAALKVFVSIPPQAFIVERIGAEYVDVHILIPPGRDPHTYEPTPRLVSELGRAKLFFRIGMSFEDALLSKIRRGHGDLVVVDTDRGIAKRPVSGRVDARISREELDPHIWLSPPLIKIQARNVAEALIAADSIHAEEFSRNLESLLEEIDETDARIRKALAPFKGRAFYVFHPAFGYFGDAYGLRQEAVEVGGKSPMPRQLHMLIEKAKREKVRIVFVEPQFDTRSAEAVARSIGGVVVPMDPLAEDVLANLVRIADRIEKSLR